jgi:hypothetical protein
MESKSSNLKTNNSHLQIKVSLRIDNLPDHDPLYVLDAYAGKGHIWNSIKKQETRDIRVLQIDKVDHPNVDIVTDNLKVLAGINLSRFHVIDLDAYGCPFAQLQVLFNHGYAGTVFVTYIQTHHGALPHGILKQSGFTKEMIRKSQTLFTSNPLSVMEQFLSNNGISSYKIKYLDRKHYMCFDVPKKGGSND